jgi:UDP-glucose 4-epimerase
MAVLVTGGAGYIGSAFVERLIESGERAVVLDDLSRGHRAAVHPEAAFYEGRTGDRELLARIARENPLDACVHFAAFAYVGESVTEPARYYENNFTQAQGLFEGLLAGGVKRVVFSSTCATYGVPARVPIPDDHPQWPINPYGWSKLFVERLLDSFDRAYGLRFAALRARASTTSPRPTSCRSRCAPPPGPARRSGCSASTTTRPTARRCATTSTSPTWPTRTCSRSATSGAAASRCG